MILVSPSIGQMTSSGKSRCKITPFLLNRKKYAKNSFILCFFIRNFAEKMKFISLHIVLFLLYALCACSNTCHDYTVNCSFTDVKTDSVTLHVLEGDYDMMRMACAATVVNGEARLQGQIDAHVIAMLKISGVDQQVYFILEPGVTSMQFNSDCTLVHGGLLNHAYALIEQQRDDLSKQRMANRKQYLKLVADSTLTQKQELTMLKTDSVLCDSIQRITVTAINDGGLVGALVRQQYANTLDSLHRSQLK